MILEGKLRHLDLPLLHIFCIRACCWSLTRPGKVISSCSVGYNAVHIHDHIKIYHDLLLNIKSPLINMINIAFILAWNGFYF